jgi:hypothetical protein
MFISQASSLHPSRLLAGGYVMRITRRAGLANYIRAGSKVQMAVIVGHMDGRIVS